MTCQLKGDVFTHLDGSYPLLKDINVVIKTEPETGTMIQIGNADAQPLASDGTNRWKCVELSLTITKTTQGLELTRFQETVQLGDKSSKPQDTDEEKLDDVTPRLMMACNVPGVAVAAVRDGRIAWTRHYGVKKNGKPERVDDNTVFEACSMSKPFFAYAMLKLVEEGRMDLDTPLVKYLGHPYIADQPLHEKITARMALQHTGGFPNWRPGGRTKPDGLEVHFEPGTQFKYSGEGIWFLQRAVEKVTGEPLAEWMETQLQKPLGMTSSSYVWNSMAYPDTAAAGHTEGGTAREKRPLYNEGNAAFSLYTTPSDYARFLIEVMKEDRSASWSLNKKWRDAMLNERFEVPANSSGNKTAKTYRSLGWVVVEDAKGMHILHGGSNGTGFRCRSQFDPKSGEGIVIMTNADNGKQVYEGMLKVLE